MVHYKKKYLILFMQFVFSRLAITFLSFIGLSSFYKMAEDLPALNYIDQYRDLAIVEMHRSGIPASIILSQALHESNCGSSILALEANNHFGIKCKSYWVGKTYYHKDDDLNENGQLTESCFRSYSSALESYVDHSNFLMSSKNYQALFNIDRTDFKAWAHGLKKSGYATDMTYSEKLIALVEKFDLHQFDIVENPYRSRLLDKQ